MKKIIILALVPFSIFICNSCFFNSCEKITIHNSEKEWLLTKKIGNKQLFVSNFGRVDTLTFLEYKDDYSPCNKLEISNFQFNLVNLEFSSTLFQNSTIYIQLKISESRLIERGFNFNDLYGYFKDNELNEFKDKIKILSFKDSISCFTFNLKNSKPENNNTVSSFSWNNKHGFLRYETTDGEIFELQNKKVSLGRG